MSDCILSEINDDDDDDDDDDDSLNIICHRLSLIGISAECCRCWSITCMQMLSLTLRKIYGLQPTSRLCRVFVFIFSRVAIKKNYSDVVYLVVTQTATWLCIYFINELGLLINMLLKLCD